MIIKTYLNKNNYFYFKVHTGFINEKIKNILDNKYYIYIFKY